MQQDNRDNAKGFQTTVEGGAAYIGTNHIYQSSQPPRGIPFQALALPKDYVDRPEIRQVIKSKLIDCSVSRPGTLVVSAIYGLGGVGKSVMAAALAHDQDVQEVCADGVLWVTLGQNPDLLPCLYAWVKELGDYDFNPTTIDSASSHLRSLLRDKKMLLVVDDAWNTDHVVPFQVGGDGCRVLVTTREAHVPDADRIDMDVMSEAEALELLLSKAQVKSLTAEDDEKARKLVAVLGGLPLAVDLAGAQIADGVSWNELLEDMEAEIAYLESLDRPNAEGVRDEKTRKRLSLKASLNLSLKILTAEQRQQFAWLGVLPEDVAIQPEMATTLWSIPLKQARAILRTFRAKALLLSGVEGLGQESGYRIHDLMHDLARGLLTGEGEKDIPGLDLQWQDVHGILLDRYRQQTKAGLWHTLTNDGYIHSYLTWHMEQAGRLGDLHELFQEVTTEGRNGWYELCDFLGQNARFVTDLGRAWQLANEMNSENISQSIGLQIRYALIFSTLNSLASNIPAELMAALLKYKKWTPAQGLAYAQQAQDSNKRAEIIQELAPHLPENLLSEALEVARGIQDEYLRANVLRRLAPHLPENLLSEALEVARGIQSESDRARALRRLAPHLPENLLSEALEVAHGIQDDSDRAEALSVLAPHLPENLLLEALELTRDIQSESYRAEALRGLTPHLLENLFSEALEVARGIQDDSDRANVLSVLAPHLPENLLLEALELTRDIQYESYRAEALSVLAPHLPENLFSEALELTRDIQSESYRADALRGLAPHLPENLLSEALEVARGIKDEYVRAKALSSLAPHINLKNFNFTFWSEFLHTLAHCDRKHLLQDIPKLAPAIIHLSDRSTLNLVAQAIREVCQQWPSVILVKSSRTNPMSDPIAFGANGAIEALCTVLLDIATTSPGANINDVIAQVKSALDRNVELSNALQTDARMLQINLGQSKGYQVLVEGNATAYIGDQYELDTEAVIKALGQLLDEIALNQSPIGTPQNLPRSGVVEFVGRDDKLIELHDRLQSNQRIAITAVQGMSGIGKTELALQYATHQLQQGQYPAGLCWLRARDQEIATDIVTFAQVHLGLSLPDQLEIEEQVRFCWQRWPQGEALIILDDVTDYQAIAPYLPPADPRFKLLITTRLNLGSTVQKIDIEELDEDSAIDLLESLVKDGRIQAQPADAQALCNWVGYLPLALELLGRFLARKPDWSISKLLKALEEKRLAAKALVDTENGMTGQLGIAAALELSWQELNEPEQELACVLGMFAIAPIPWSLVERCQPEMEPDNLEDTRDDGLMARSLLKRVSDSSYQLHQIVQEYFRIKLSERVDQVQTIKVTFWQVMVEIAKGIDASPTIDQIEQVRELIAHLEEGVRSWIDSITDEDLIVPFVGIGYFYEGQGNYSFAEPWRRNCLEVTQQRLGEEHLDIATSLNNVAGLYESQGKYEEAEPFYLSALEMRKRLLGEEHFDIATSMNDLAVLYCSQGKYGKAEPLYLSALEMYKRILGEEHPDIARSINNLAVLYCSQGKYKEAEPFYLSALEMHKRMLGEEHPDIAMSLNNLAALYESQGKYEEAEPLCLSALEMRKRLLGEEHPHVAMSLNNLAALYESQEKYEEAESLYLSALEMRKRLLGEETPFLATSLSNLAGLYKQQGKYEKAELICLSVLEMRKRLLGKEHPHIAMSLNDLAVLCQNQDRCGEADALYRQALAIAESTLGFDHPTTQSILNRLNSLLQPPE
jgi:Tfp pilus assembly protein PilF